MNGFKIKLSSAMLCSMAALTSSLLNFGVPRLLRKGSMRKALKCRHLRKASSKTLEKLVSEGREMRHGKSEDLPFSDPGCFSIGAMVWQNAAIWGGSTSQCQHVLLLQNIRKYLGH